MNRDEAMLRHPSMRAKMYRIHDNDQFDAHANEAMNLANSGHRPSEPTLLAQMFVSVMTGGLTGAAVFAVLMVVAL